MKLHELKTWWRFFDKTWNGIKKFEIRFDDRNYQINDILLLREYNKEYEHYMDRAILCIITYIIDDPNFVKEGFVVMSIDILKRFEWWSD